MSEHRVGIRRTGDETEERIATEVGPQLISRLHGLLRAARLYSRSNQTYRRMLQELMATIAEAMEDETTLVGMGDYFYVNGVRLKGQGSQMALFRALMAEFESRGLGAVRFLPGVTAEEIETFLDHFGSARDPESAEKLPERVSGAGVVHIVPVLARDLKVVNESDGVEEGAEARTERERAKQTFSRAVIGMKSIMLRTAQSGRPAIRQARRLVQPIVDSIMKNEYSIIGLTALKDHDEYTYAHCVNVSILSVGIGQVLGLSRQALANLGVAALLHDIGKIAIPSELLQKSAALTPEEWSLMRRHPLEGVKMVTRLPGASTLTLDTMRVCFQHHVNFDCSGYPEFPSRRIPAPMTRIVAVADFFDAVTAHRAYRPRPYTPWEALHLLMGAERPHFDPAALVALVRVVGLYPAGSVLVTSSNHVVLSLSPSPTDPRRPNCRVLVWPDGRVYTSGQATDWEPLPAGETVERVLDPEEHEFDTKLFLAA